MLFIFVVFDNDDDDDGLVADGDVEGLVFEGLLIDRPHVRERERKKKFNQIIKKANQHTQKILILLLLLHQKRFQYEKKVFFLVVLI